MKFCPECGSQLQIETAKFCPSCGFNLLTANLPSSNSHPQKSVPEPKQDIQEAAIPSESIAVTTEGEERIDEEKPMSIYMLGTRLEDMTEKILQNMGYSTQKRQRIADSGGSKHEIDIYATKGSRVRAIECKNYDPSRSVGIKELRDFHSKVVSLKIRDALFVTNTTYSSESEKFATSRNIMLWDGDELRERFFSMTLGRLGSGEQTTLELALPVNMTYEEISRLELVNPELTKSQARLVLHPYYKFEWKVDIVRYDPARGKHRVLESGVFVVDALDGEIINPKETISGKLSGLFKKSDEKLAMREGKRIAEDIIEIKPESRYKVFQTSEYAASVVKPTVKSQNAQKTIIQQVIEDTRKEEDYKVRTKYGEDTKQILLIAKSSEVIIKKASLVYVPKWNIDTESGQVTFMRKALAASKTVLVDTIAHCPRHLSIGDTQLVKKQTYAICEVCGSAFCKDHAFLVEGKYYCEEHNPNKPVTNNTNREASKHQEQTTGDQLKKAEDGAKKALGGLKSLFK
jgi:hypothetical protein